MWMKTEFKHKAAQRLVKFKLRLAEDGFNVAALTLHNYRDQKVVYILASEKDRNYYIGSTKFTASKRHGSRLASVRDQNQRTSREGAIRYWKKRHNLHKFCLFPVACCNTHIEAINIEDRLIHKYQPQLNYPWVTKFDKSAKSGKKWRTLNGHARLVGRYILGTNAHVKSSSPPESLRQLLQIVHSAAQIRTNKYHVLKRIAKKTDKYIRGVEASTTPAATAEGHSGGHTHQSPSEKRPPAPKGFLPVCNPTAPTPEMARVHAENCKDHTEHRTKNGHCSEL